MSQFQVLKGLCREEKEIEIWKVCKLCPKGEILGRKEVEGRARFFLFVVRGGLTVEIV